MSAMASGEDSSTKRPPAEGTMDQGESKKAATGDKACSAVAGENPPSRRGIIVDLMVEDADKFVDFMSKTTEAKEYFRFAGDNGKVMHLALDIDGVSAYVEELGNNMDKSEVATPHVRLHVNTDDPMALAEKLLKAGAKEVNKCEEQFWGSKFGVFLDPYGQTWAVSNTSTPLHDVPKELARKVIPFVSVRDAAGYITFLTEVFGAETVYPPAKDPTGKIMCAELKMNGGLIMIGDHCGKDVDKQDASVTVSYEVSAGKAVPLAKAFEANGGEIVEVPSMKFWGQVWGRAKDAFGQPWGLCEVQAGPPPSEEEMAVDMKIGAKHDWKYTWVKEDVPKMHCYGEVRTCLAKGPSISKAMSEMMPLGFAGAAKAGMPPVAPPMSAYFMWDSEENGEAIFTCGPTVAGGGAAAAEGNALGVRTAGGCECVTVVHVGPYDGLMGTYTATFEWIAAKGYECVMPVMEIYENDAKEVEASKLRTKICVPIVKKGTTPKA